MNTSWNVPTSRILRTVEEASKQLRLSEKTLRKMIAAGEIEIVRLGWKLFITQDAIYTFIDANRQRQGGRGAAE